MGPRICGFTKGETKYSLRLFPIGGYCAMEGEDEESESDRAFNNVSAVKRMIIVIAGAVMNILLGIVMMFTLVLTEPSFTSTTIDDFTPNAFTANSGLQQGDKIIEVNNYNIYNYNDFSFALYTMPVKTVNGNELNIYKEDCTWNLYNIELDYDKLSKEQVKEVYEIQKSGAKLINKAQTKQEAQKYYEEYYEKLAKFGDKKLEVPEIEVKETRQRFRCDVKVVRNGEKITIKDVDFFTYRKEAGGDPTLSMDFYLAETPKNFGTVISETFSRSVSIVRMVWNSLVGLVTGQFGINDVSGPVGMVTAISDVAKTGLLNGLGSALYNVAFVMVIITINLGIFNMLPFPALDGGRFLLLFIEAVFHKHLPRKYEAYINAAGLIILFGFMILVTVKDVWKIFTG